METRYRQDSWLSIDSTRLVLRIILVLIGAVVTLPLWCQNKQDYHWVMGYAWREPQPGIGGTDWIFGEDSLRLQRVERESRFYLTNYSIADSLGKLEMYSNGCHIYNEDHEIITNGDSINYGDIWEEQCSLFGYSYAMGGVIMDLHTTQLHKYPVIHARVDYFPIPGITVGSRALFYSEVVKDTMNKKYRLVVKDSLIVDSMIQGGHLKSIRHSNGTDWWVIQPGRYDDRYFTMKISERGIDTLFVQTIPGGEMGTGGDGGGQAVFSPNGKRYARFDIIENGVLVMEFDRQTGLLSNPKRYHVNDETGGITGGCAFSPNSRFLYVSASSKVYQFDMWAQDVGSSKELVAEWDGFVDPFPTNFYLCNLGPDCRIYINSTSSARSMHVIQYPDRKGQACEVAQHAIKLRSLNLGTMPNFPHYRIDEDWPCDSTIGVKLVTSIDLPEERVEFKVYPNPADKVLYLEYQLDGIKDMTFELYNMSGDLMRRSQVTYREFSQELDIKDLPAGLYAWRLFNDEGAFTSGKVVVE